VTLRNDDDERPYHGLKAGGAAEVTELVIFHVILLAGWTAEDDEF
jgi:hypothetical protein